MADEATKASSTSAHGKGVNDGTTMGSPVPNGFANGNSNGVGICSEKMGMPGSGTVRVNEHRVAELSLEERAEQVCSHDEIWKLLLSRQQ